MDSFVINLEAISSRKYVQDMFNDVLADNASAIDMKNVLFISRSAAHELVRQIEQHKKERDVTLKNANESVRRMIRIVNTASIFS